MVLDIGGLVVGGVQILLTIPVLLAMVSHHANEAQTVPLLAVFRSRVAQQRPGSVAVIGPVAAKADDGMHPGLWATAISATAISTVSVAHKPCWPSVGPLISGLLADRVGGPMGTGGECRPRCRRLSCRGAGVLVGLGRYVRRRRRHLVAGVR
jgi:hypothetical protein